MTILVVAAHPDDEILGCGASIAKWASLGDEVHILIMAEGATSRDNIRDADLKSDELLQLAKSAQLACKIIGASAVTLLGFPDNRMDSVDRLDVIKAVEKEVDRLQPHTLVTHHSGDLNIDHRITHEAVLTACRPQPGCSVRRILSFEIPSSTDWQELGNNTFFQPNWFEDVSAYIEYKIEALKVYESEMKQWPHSRSIENVKNLSLFRGSSVGCESAEAFMLIRNIQ